MLSYGTSAMEVFKVLTASPALPNSRVTGTSFPLASIILVLLKVCAWPTAVAAIRKMAIAKHLYMVCYLLRLFPRGLARALTRRELIPSGVDKRRRTCLATGLRSVGVAWRGYQPAYLCMTRIEDLLRHPANFSWLMWR